MTKAKVTQYILAAAMGIAWFLTDDQVLAAVGLWLSPSAVTIIAAVAGAVARRGAAA